MVASTASIKAMNETTASLVSAHELGFLAEQDEHIAQLQNDAMNRASIFFTNKAIATPSFIQFERGAMKNPQLNTQGPLRSAISLFTATKPELRSPYLSAANAFLSKHGGVFGLRSHQGAAQQQLALRGSQKRFDNKPGFHHFIYDQVYHGVPVFGAQLRVHMYANDADDIMITAANGVFLPQIYSDGTLSPIAKITVEEAEKIAVSHVQDGLRSIAASKEVFSLSQEHHPELFVHRTNWFNGDASHKNGSNHLVYKVTVGNNFDILEYVFVDAHTGQVVDQLSGTSNAMHRVVIQGENPQIVWQEGDNFPTNDTEVNNAIQGAQYAYQFFMNAFGHDSFDNFGSTLISLASFVNDTVCPNAFWNGQYITYCTGLAVTDVAAHEWTHAVTQYTDGLIYAAQSGALNEAYSDIFGETIDIVFNEKDPLRLVARTAGTCIDLVNNNNNNSNSNAMSTRWLLGQDLNKNNFPDMVPLRDMWLPSCKGNPDSISHEKFVCDPNLDNGGVHLNSGVPNRAYAVLVDGYNDGVNPTITGIGLTKAAHIYWRAKTVYQTPTTTFADHAHALWQSCQDLALAGTNLNDLKTGQPSGQVVQASDCDQVAAAINLVQLLQDPVERCKQQQPI